MPPETSSAGSGTPPLALVTASQEPSGATLPGCDTSAVLSAALSERRPPLHEKATFCRLT